MSVDAVEQGKKMTSEGRRTSLGLSQGAPDNVVKAVEQYLAWSREVSIQNFRRSSIGLPTDTPENVVEAAERYLDWEREQRKKN